MTREQLYHLVEADQDTGEGNWYVNLSIVCTIASIVPLAFKGTNPAFEVVEWVVTVFFTIDYLIRWATADYRSKRRSPWCFVLYPFTFMAIIDVVSMLPTYLALNASFRLLRTARLLRVMKVTRVFKAMRYSASVLLIQRVLHRQRDSLIAVTMFAAAYVLVCALVIFNIEPSTFETFFDAIYWATVSLTTVGYGDIFATSPAGRIVTMISSVFGIAVVALPASIITAGFMEELEERHLREGKTLAGDAIETLDASEAANVVSDAEPDVGSGAKSASGMAEDSESRG